MVLKMTKQIANDKDCSWVLKSFECVFNVIMFNLSNFVNCEIQGMYKQFIDTNV